MLYLTLDGFVLHHLADPTCKFFIAPPIAGLDMPLTRSSQYNKSGQDGVTVAQQFLGERRITIQGYLVVSNLADYESNRKTFLALNQPIKDIYGNLVPHLMRFQTMDGTYYILNVQVMSPPKMDRNLINSATWTLDLLATDPAIQSDNLNSKIINPSASGGFSVPATIPVSFDSSSGGLYNLANAGNYPAWPIIVLNGPLTNPNIINETTGEFMNLALDLNSGDQIIIDCLNKTIVQGGVTNQISTKTYESTFWTLQPGNNVINLPSGVPDQTGSAIISWRDQWVGI